MLSLVDRLGEILGAADLPRKRVMVKCDSGPGRLNVEILARMKFFGFYLYPGVPNTTAVRRRWTGTIVRLRPSSVRISTK